MCKSPCCQPLRTLKYDRKPQEDAPKCNLNTYMSSSLASSKPQDLLYRETTLVKTARPDIPPGKKKRKNAVSPTNSGPVGLHESSTIHRQNNVASEPCEGTLEVNQFSASGSVSSLVESHDSTRKSKRIAASLIENAVGSGKDSGQPSKRPKTNLNDFCGTKVCWEFIQVLKS